MIWLPVVGDYADIDVYASIIAYTELLNRQHKSAKSYLPAPLNYSIPNELRIKELENFDIDIETEDKLIVLDISEPDIINKMMQDEQILELIDHHPGYEEYWQSRLGDNSIIEKIGAVATIIFERWGDNIVPPEIARPLLAAILDNTLNFNASITTERDRQAAKSLSRFIGSTVEDFAGWYFSTVSNTILNNLSDSLLGDTKNLNTPKLNSDVLCGQLAVWDPKEVVDKKDIIAEAMGTKSANWFVNVLSISEKRNYILANSDTVADYLSGILDLTKKGGWLVSDGLFLRKEILSKIHADS